MMQCDQCHRVFTVMGDALNAQVETVELLEMTAKALVEQFDLKACHFRLLSRDQKILEHVASHGLSERFLAKGPVDAEKSVAAALEGNVVAVLDCVEDPRVQYPEAFKAEGNASMLTIPLIRGAPDWPAWPSPRQRSRASRPCAAPDDHPGSH